MPIVMEEIGHCQYGETTIHEKHVVPSIDSVMRQQNMKLSILVGIYWYHLDVTDPHLTTNRIPYGNHQMIDSNGLTLYLLSYCDNPYTCMIETRYDLVELGGKSHSFLIRTTIWT